MLNFRFILPFVQALYTSAVFMGLISNGAKINLLTFTLYLLNILVMYLMYRTGRILDKCLKRLKEYL